MKKIGIFYGSSTGTTEAVARKIAKSLDIADSDIYNATKITTELINSYDVLLLGSSTWGMGELQDDWFDSIEILKKADLKSKIVALFGCGDSSCYSDTFCDAIGIMYKDLEKTGCKFCGSVDSSEYEFSASMAEVNGNFVGLAIDDVNESNKTDDRIKSWIATLKNECLS